MPSSVYDCELSFVLDFCANFSDSLYIFYYIVPHVVCLVGCKSFPTFKVCDHHGVVRCLSFITKNLMSQCGYLDLFPFYEKEQKTLLANIRGNEALIANVLRITQTEIERIAPSLLIIANKSTYPFWGASDDCVWMGYDFQKVSEDDLPDSLKNRGLDIRIIKGFRQDELARREIIYRPQDGVCRLKGTVTVMYSHSRNLASEHRLTESDFVALHDFSKIVKSISKYL